MKTIVLELFYIFCHYFIIICQLALFVCLNKKKLNLKIEILLFFNLFILFFTISTLELRSTPFLFSYPLLPYSQAIELGIFKFY